MLVTRQERTAAEVDQFIVERLLPTVGGEPLSLFAMASITLMLTSQRPEITDDQVCDGVKDISAYITTWLSALPEVQADSLTGIEKVEEQVKH